MESGQHRMTLRCLLSVRGSRLQGLHGDEGNFLGNTPKLKGHFIEKHLENQVLRSQFFVDEINFEQKINSLIVIDASSSKKNSEKRPESLLPLLRKHHLDT